VTRLSGIGVSPGVAVGRAVLLTQSSLAMRFSIGENRVAEELERLHRAQERSRQQLREIRARLATGPAADLAPVFDAQLLMLDDPMLVARAAEVVRRQHVNAEWAVQRAFDELAAVFEGIEDPYLRERKGDVADIAGRLRMNLRPDQTPAPDLFRNVGEASILITDELTPSVAAQVDWQKVRGFAADAGSRTYHTAILARSLGVPAVVGLGSASVAVAPGTRVVIDGSVGEIAINPSEDELQEVVARAARRADAERTLEATGAGPARTADGVKLVIQANVELPEDVATARRCGAEGIGLYRSEFLLTTTLGGVPTEEIQYRAYRGMLEAMFPAPVTIRTFDIDDEQVAGWTPGAVARPPRGLMRSRGPMGLRATRLLLDRRDVFRAQLRALLRAAPSGRLRVMFPFISGVDELREARRVLDEARADLTRQGLAPPPVPVGIMLEIPSAAATADLLAREVDFFSIGTNDLIQYSLAVDRTDARVAHLYEPLHPAILRTLRGVIRAARRRSVPVALCGEMAADPVLLPVLVGLGLRELSMSPAAIPVAKRVLSQVNAAVMRSVVRELMCLPSVADIERRLADALAGGAEGHEEESR